uniref:Zinc finger protein 1035 n=1 Tax=Mastacembelus armatus TaxID=205130 RepID=A0A7N8XGS1_9TELE
ILLQNTIYQNGFSAILEICFQLRASALICDCHLVDTSDKNEQSVDSHSESCLQQDGSAASMCSCAEKEWTSSTRKISATSIPDPECSSPAMTSGPNALNVSHSLECGLQSDTSTTDNNPGLTKEWTSPAENSDTTASSDQQWSPQTPEAQEPQTPEGIVAENARGSFEELDTSIQGQVLLGMLYGEPLSREYSSCDTEEMKPDTCQYKVKLDRPDRTHVDDSKRQLPQLKSSGQMRRHLQPVVILKTLESTNGMGNSYYCAKCQHTTHNVDHLIEHHSCCHSLPKFQYCKTCNLYLMVNEQTEKHLCGKTKESPQQTSDSSLQGKRKRHGRHKCTRCGLVFSKLVKYISHTRIHTGKTPYKCNGCGLYFAQGSSLQRHMRHTHQGETPYRCLECGKRFKKRAYLIGHKNRPYQCVYCPRTFSKKTRLKDHHRGHKRNSLLLCSRCGQYFGFTKLNQHQK